MQLNTPSPDDALQWFTSLPQLARGAFLSALSHNLTVAARSFFNALEPAKSDAVRARVVNELLHQVTGYLLHIHAGDEDTTWAPFVTKRLLEQNDPGIRLQVHQAWHYAAKVTHA